MSRYIISLNGCDDSTHVVVHLSRPAVALIERIAADVATKAADTHCKPTLALVEFERATDYVRREATGQDDD